MIPFVILNFKAYKEATGKWALQLAKFAEKIPASVILCVQAPDIFLVSRNTKLPVFAQHADLAYEGAFTGSVTLHALKSAGAKGVMLNHSEKRLALKEIIELVVAAKRLKLKTLVCVKDLKEAQEVLPLEPDFVAFEVPELIGSGKPVTAVYPKSVAEFSKLFQSRTVPLCGAGIQGAKDVDTAVTLGAKGVLVASAFVKNPKGFLKEFKF